MKKTGWIIIFCALIVTVGLWVLSKDTTEIIFTYPLKSLGQITALLGVVLISFEFILATRSTLIEGWFGGLDKVYHAHRILGGVGFALIVYHPLFLMVNALPNMRAVMNLIIPSSILPYDYGIFALYSMFALIFLTFYVTLPYHLWKMTHIFMGIPLGFVILHILFITSDISNFIPLRIWIVGLGCVAMAAYIYKRFLYTKFGPRYEYEIADITRTGQVTELILKPVSRTITFNAGQFVFISFDNKWLSREKHPFTIASSPHDETLRFAIKSLGDYTSKLEVLQVGNTVALFGPYGEFGKKASASAHDQIWIAGGIGITPFLSLAKYLSARGNTGNITIYYCVKNKSEAIYMEELMRAESNQKFKVFNFCSDTEGHINAESIVRATCDPKEKLILLCGPVGMTSLFAYDFKTRYHVPHKNIISEEFSFLEQ